jgi:hypothetical protein
VYKLWQSVLKSYNFAFTTQSSYSFAHYRSTMIDLPLFQLIFPFLLIFVRLSSCETTNQKIIEDLCPIHCSSNSSMWSTYQNDAIDSMLMCTRKPKLLKFPLGIPLDNPSLNHVVQACTTFRSDNLTTKLVELENPGVDTSGLTRRIACQKKRSISNPYDNTSPVLENPQLAWSDGE